MSVEPRNFDDKKDQLRIRTNSPGASSDIESSEMADSSVDNSQKIVPTDSTKPSSLLQFKGNQDSPPSSADASLEYMLRTMKEFHQALSSIDPTQDVKLREELLTETRKVLFALETPDKILERVCFQVLETVVIFIAMKMGIFSTMYQKDPGQTISAQDLAAATGADLQLVQRNLRFLSVFGAIDQPGPDVYRLNKVSLVFSQQIGKDAMETT